VPVEQVDEVVVVVPEVRRHCGQPLPNPEAVQQPPPWRHQVVSFANSSSPTPAEKSPWSFNTFVSTPYQSPVVTEVAIKERGIRRFVAIACNAEQRIASRARLDETVRANGAEVLTVESYDVNATDFRTQLTKLQAARADALTLFGTGGKAEELIIKRMAKMGFKIQMLGPRPSMEGPDVIKTVKDGQFVLYSP
jgi:branched-chain amino acid transport system substrate-binding protein